MGFVENMPKYGFSMTRIFPHEIESILRLCRRIRVKNYSIFYSNTGFYACRLDKIAFPCPFYILYLIILKYEIKIHKKCESDMIQK